MATFAGFCDVIGLDCLEEIWTDSLFRSVDRLELMALLPCPRYAFTCCLVEGEVDLWRWRGGGWDSA